jgi:shikimate kinase
MNLKLKRTPGLYVTGFMAAGKSTIARHLAGELGWSFFDLDEEIERAEGATIAALFDTHGEAEFRRREAVILAQHVKFIERGRPSVLALGGGTFAQDANRELVMTNGMAIWLDCPFETVRQRVSQATHRPLARDMEKFAELYEARRPIYGLADIHIAIESDDPAVAVKAILAHPLLK